MVWPRGWRNQVWETDHVQAPVLVDVDGEARRPWITWFTDGATNAITGVAVMPGDPSRESVLAALRSAVLREDPYGPFGGLPEKVRVDRGKDFLSRTVTAALGLLDVTVEDLPAYTPHLKGTVEGLNRAVESMFLTALPGYGPLSVAGLRRCVHAALAIRYRLDWRGGAFGGAADDGRLDVGDAQADHVAGEKAVFRRAGDRPSRPRTSTAPAGFRPGRGCLRIDHAGIVVRDVGGGEAGAGWRH
ncbi:Integrase catalytic region [Actinobacteria bacterium OK006]|nr:Integrase catalytic region [Actinobacteria bacterium OK006]